MKIGFRGVSHAKAKAKGNRQWQMKGQGKCRNIVKGNGKARAKSMKGQGKCRNIGKSKVKRQKINDRAKANAKAKARQKAKDK